MWLRSDAIKVVKPARVDVTVRYGVVNCKLLKYPYCKESLFLYVHKTATVYDNTQNKVPDPYSMPEKYENFASTKPKITVGKITKPDNNETYSFLTNSSAIYYYLAIQYKGGCFNLYNVAVSYSVCPSLALHDSLIQLPRTMAPADGSLQVSGSCPVNALPLVNNVTLYGECNANGEWSSNVTGGECRCKAGYGKYLNGSGRGAFCNDCPIGTYNDKARNSPCINCPLNSQQNANRTLCDCEPLYYRTDNDTYFDDCTGPPTRPQNLTYPSLNATSVSLVWSPPLDPGGRSDLYYEIQCSKCEKKYIGCYVGCDDDIVIIHENGTSRTATAHHLSPYTSYKFKVFSKNGISHIAEKKYNRKPGFGEVSFTTMESVPGIPTVEIKVDSPTSVKLKWELRTKNGIITYYRVIFFEEGNPSGKHTFNTTKTSYTITHLREGRTYNFQVQGSTKVGLGKPSQLIKVELSKIFDNDHDRTKVPINKKLLYAIAGGVVGILVLIILVLCICLLKRKKRRKEDFLGHTSLVMLNSDIPMEDGHKMYIDPSNYGSPMEALLSNTNEIDFHDIKLEQSIGGGEFAEVYKGILSKGSEKEIVAVKILKHNASLKGREDFIREASIMGQFEHPNVIELKGVVTSSPETPMMIVAEFMENGSLNNFLKRYDGQLAVLQLLGIARGVASGMAYLAGMKFIHRDLAARNILVAENMASKVADFGLSRELDDSEDNPDSEYTTQGGKIPIRWTAPEAIRYRKFSSASDVWSYGILLWEIMSYVERPYWGWDNFQVMDRVEEGYRLPAPMNCPKSIHNIMLDCWDADKNNRPKFVDIVKRLQELIRSPEKITDDSANNRYHAETVDVNLDEGATVETWLESISMARYANLFADAGYVELTHVTTMDEEDLTRIGVRLIGHRNKISKSIKAINMKAKPPKEDTLVESDEEVIV